MSDPLEPVRDIHHQALEAVRRLEKLIVELDPAIAPASHAKLIALNEYLEGVVITADELVTDYRSEVG